MNEKLIKKENNEEIDLFWKAREFKPVEKSVDWYWAFWIISFSIIFIIIYFFQDYFLAILFFLISLVGILGHKKTPEVIEYRVNKDGLLLNNGKKELFFDEIESYNIDEDEKYIFINTKNKLEKLISIPFEANHNISVIEKILSSKLKKDSELDIPFLEKILNKMLGF